MRLRHCDGCRCDEPRRLRILTLEHDEKLAVYGDHDPADGCAICAAYRWGALGLTDPWFHIPVGYATKVAFAAGREERKATA